jgi:hypothetical protein
MSDYQKLFKELRYEIWKVAFLNAFLNAAIAFFLSNIIFTLFRERYIYSFIPAVIVFAWSFIRMTRRYTLKRIEEGNPEVAEILRTAHDNSEKDNLMVHALFLELMQKMETVTAGVFISAKSAMFKVLLITVLAITPVIITGALPFLIMDNPLADSGGLGGVLGVGGLAPTGSVDDAGERDIYGEREVVQLGNEKLEITASSGSGGADFTQQDEANGRAFKYNDYPTDVQAEQTTAGTGGREEEASLINQYSNYTRNTPK